MQDALAPRVLEAAYNLAEGSQEAMRGIARAAASATPRGPVVVGCFGPDALLDLPSLHFERPDDRYARGILEWQRVTSPGLRRQVLSLAPSVVSFHTEEFEQLAAEHQALARELFPLCAMANTGDGGALHVAFGNPDMGVPARIHHFHAIAQHLAAAWRLRTRLSVAETMPAIAAELRVDGSPAELGPDASAPTAREALRRAVIARERARTGRRSVGDHELWPALVAGRWSLLDAFTAAGTRYIIAYENPAGATELRALPALERLVLEHALAGRSGKWIALELELSEPTVARTLRAALRRLGVADIAALAGVRTARFEPLEDADAGADLAIARLTPAMLSLATLSQAERDIVTGILGGKRIAVIASERGTSPRTVAHQTASIYQKLGVSSRRELLAQLR